MKKAGRTTKPVPGRDADPGYNLVLAVMDTADALLRESVRLFRPHGVTAAQFNVLNVLATRGVGGLSQRELGEALVVDRSNVSGLLDRMEKAGWVARTDHPTDRRIYQIVLTPAGRALRDELHPRYLEAVRQLTQHLPVREMKTCAAVLASLKKASSVWNSTEVVSRR